MKKNSFVEGTLMASISLIFIKILGAIYVIPFYSIVGELGGALYSYAYTIYSLVLNICTAGIPLAISKIVSEYNTLEMYDAKERTLKVGNRLIMVIGSVLFLATFIFAKEAAHIFIGNSTGGNSIESIELVIRSISFCLLIIPLLAIKKGYLQGQKFITPTTTSQVLEQIVRIAFILVGSYIAVSVIHLSVSWGVAIACFGSFLGGLSAYIYLEVKIKKNTQAINMPKKGKLDKVTNKSILKKIIRFSIPLIIVVMAGDLYNVTDIALINRGLLMIGYSGGNAETIASIIATWASKICLIVNAIAVGLSISLIPNMVSSLIKKDSKSVNNYFVKALGIVIVVGLPMSVGISILAKELYLMFYGYSEFGSIILRILPFSILLSNVNLVINSALQSLNKFKTMYISTFTGLIINACLDIPLILLCNKLGIYPYYGAIIATITGVCISILISMISLKKNMDFRYKDLLSVILRSLYSVAIMGIAVFVIAYLFKNTFNTRLTVLITSSICGLVGGIIYFIITYKNNLLYDVLGQNYIDRILIKLKLKKNAN